MNLSAGTRATGGVPVPSGLMADALGPYNYDDPGNYDVLASRWDDWAAGVVPDVRQDWARKADAFVTGGEQVVELGCGTGIPILDPPAASSTRIEGVVVRRLVLELLESLGYQDDGIDLDRNRLFRPSD